MSIRYVERAIWAKGLGKTKKAVLIAIADAVSDNGIGWLLISSLMKKTDLSERAIQVAIAELSDTQDGTVLPILERRERAKRSSIFRVYLDRIPQHDHGASDKEMTADEMWGAGAAPLKSNPAGAAPHPRTGCTPPPQGLHPEPSIEPSIEPNPPLPSVEPPHGEFSLELVSDDPRSVDLIEYVQAEWKKVAGEYPRIQSLRGINPSRAKAIRARAKEATDVSDGQMTAHDVWDQIFAAIRASAFLRGEAPPTKDYPDPMSLSIDYILRPKVFLRTLERYLIDVERNRETHDATSGRRLGPAERALRNVINRMGHAAPQRRN